MIEEHISKTLQIECDFCSEKFEVKVTKLNKHDKLPINPVWINRQDAHVLLYDTSWDPYEKLYDRRDACDKCYDKLVNLNKEFVTKVLSMLNEKKKVT